MARIMPAMEMHPKRLREKGRAKASNVLKAWSICYHGKQFTDALGTEFVGALGKLAASRIVNARIVSASCESHDLRRKSGVRFEVKAGFGRQLSPDLARKEFDRYCEVKLEIRPQSNSKSNCIEIWAVGCFTRNKGGSEPGLCRVERSFRSFRVFAT
jgi:hypothetical protein